MREIADRIRAGMSLAEATADVKKAKKVKKQELDAERPAAAKKAKEAEAEAEALAPDWDGQLDVE